jgi:hypothetical protein
MIINSVVPLNMASKRLFFKKTRMDSQHGCGERAGIIGILSVQPMTKDLLKLDRTWFLRRSNTCPWHYYP